MPAIHDGRPSTAEAEIAAAAASRRQRADGKGPEGGQTRAHPGPDAGPLLHREARARFGLRARPRRFPATRRGVSRSGLSAAGPAASLDSPSLLALVAHGLS